MKKRLFLTTINIIVFSTILSSPFFFRDQSYLVFAQENRSLLEQMASTGNFYGISETTNTDESARVSNKDSFEQNESSSIGAQEEKTLKEQIAELSKFIASRKAFIEQNESSSVDAQEERTLEEQIVELRKLVERNIRESNNALAKERRERENLETTIEQLKASVERTNATLEELTTSMEQLLNYVNELGITVKQIGEHLAGELKIVRIAGVDVRFHWCPPGTFMMGSHESENSRYSDETLHKVLITQGFWLAETETTQELWHAVMEDNPSHFKNNNLPVENVSWNDCQDFIAKIQRFAPKGAEFKLPSEAHWEYACRAGSQTAYWWGSNLEDGLGKANVLDTSAKDEFQDRTTVSFGDGNVYTSFVGSFQSNAWGFVDMIGNVWEWCEDWYGDYPTETVYDPRGVFDGSKRVDRGGGYYDGTPEKLRVAFRGAFDPDTRYNDLGFRLEMTEFQGESKPVLW